MGTKTGIRWTRSSWNTVYGCTKYAPECAHCYAAEMAARFNKPGSYCSDLAIFDTHGEAQWTNKLILRSDRLDIPRHWREPRLIFVGSMTDLFHVGISDEFILENFKVMAECPRHTFQVLTKRSRRLVEFAQRYYPQGFPENVWVGVTVGCQASVDKAIDLMRVPATVRWLSVEPLIGPVVLPEVVLDGVAWIVTGGESGPRARRMLPDWPRALLRQCKSNGRNIPYFFKQWGMFDQNGVYHRNKHFPGFECLDGVAWQEYPAQGSMAADVVNAGRAA